MDIKNFFFAIAGELCGDKYKMPDVVTTLKRNAPVVNAETRHNREKITVNLNDFSYLPDSKKVAYAIHAIILMECERQMNQGGGVRFMKYPEMARMLGIEAEHTSHGWMVKTTCERVKDLSQRLKTA